MKICIITLYGDDNFGNKLQNYATLKKLEKYGKVETLKNGFYRVQNYPRKILNKIIKYSRKKNERIKMFKEFNQYLNIKYSSDRNKVKNISDKYDYFIYGSDQIWNPGKDGINNLYLGTAMSGKKNIAFSASFGVSEIPEKYKKNVGQALMRFKNISVREDAGKRIIEEISDRKDIEVLVDPTMLLKKEEWEKVYKKPKQLNNEKYILNYFLGELSQERKNEINKLANEKGWNVFNILDENDPMYISGPSEFLYLEANAELICTDSFHSCVFGILLDTPFLIFEREDNIKSMNSRIETLLSKFKLEDRRYNGTITKDMLQYNYNEAYEVLEIERKKSNEFIEKSFDLKKGEISES